MAKILIISTFFPPLNSIASLRPYSWAKEWSTLGHSITILTTKKNSMIHPLTVDLRNIEIIEVESSLNLEKQKSNYHENKGKKKKSLLYRFFNHLKYKFGIFNACRMPDFTDFWIYPAYQNIKDRKNWDFVISTAGPYSAHILGYLLKKNGFTQYWIADYRDTWSNNYIYPGLFPFNIIELCLEKFLLKKADLISTISEPFREEFERRFQKEAFLVYNGFNPEDMECIHEERTLNQINKFTIVHTGSIYDDKRDPTPLFQAIKELEEKISLDSLEVIFIGSELGNLQSLIDSYQVGKYVKIEGFVPRNEALKMQRNANALLFLPWNDPNIDGIFTGKIFEYLYSRTPIISVGCAHLEASQKLIASLNAGISLCSVQEIKEYLIKRIQDLSFEKTKLTEKDLNLFDRRVIAREFLSKLIAIKEKR